MPLPEDTAPGRAFQLVEELGRVVVTSPVGQYSVRSDRRHVVRHALVGGFVGWWAAGPLALLAPWGYGRLVVLLGLVVGAAVWALRFPPGARAWVQVDRFTPEEEVGGTVAWVGVRDRAALVGVTDDLVAAVRAGRLDAGPEQHGLDRVRLRWRSPLR
ncbi:hypothetical protein [Phycicoccus sonneratiae]|uniref:Uncharacterized protein n=1 Tax=Phycicoccus sonneratiae TaxID=2807628 RepID=A0ABS2CGQ8_9MICO|nr:hypothetical protein [Phycicoccus sonneraticus]MBM6399057.1 hypothetical protein [Phycicoccus sonneraticus]